MAIVPIKVLLHNNNNNNTIQSSVLNVQSDGGCHGDDDSGHSVTGTALCVAVDGPSRGCHHHCKSSSLANALLALVGLVGRCQQGAGAILHAGFVQSP